MLCVPLAVTYISLFFPTYGGGLFVRLFKKKIGTFGRIIRHKIQLYCVSLFTFNYYVEAGYAKITQLVH